MITSTLLLPIIFLLGSTLLESINLAIQTLQKTTSDRKLSKPKIYSLFVKFINKSSSGDRNITVREFLSRAKAVTAIAYAISSALFLTENHFFSNFMRGAEEGGFFTLAWFILAFALIGGVFLIFQLFFRLFSVKFPLASLKLFIPFSSFYLFLFFPIVWPLLCFESRVFVYKTASEPFLSSEKLKRRLLELLGDHDLQKMLDPRDKKLVQSLAHFGDLVVREIMVPRVDVLCTPEMTSIHEALKLFIEGGFSRIPVFSDTLDHITGVLLYKDVMEYCFNLFEQELAQIKTLPIKPLVTPIIFTPENKKIQDLFQEMRNQKIHSAIVVNEYGCTEGLVTIEDIIEELVGTEIFDEHDIIENEPQYTETEDKSWIVEGKMSIVDIERKIGIMIPHHVDYETIAGYISSKMRMIPPPGTTIHGDQFKIQILASDQRQILKVKITPTDKDIDTR